jgi:hypothetical protein
MSTIIRLRKTCKGIEQWQLVGLITGRSLVDKNPKPQILTLSAPGKAIIGIINYLNPRE